MSEGDVDNSLLPCGQIVGLVHDIPTIKDIIDSIVSGAITIEKRLGRVMR